MKYTKGKKKVTPKYQKLDLRFIHNDNRITQLFRQEEYEDKSLVT